MHKNQAKTDCNSGTSSSTASAKPKDMASSEHSLHEFCAYDATCMSSLKEVTLIETVTSFLEENGAAEVDPKVLRNLAEALSKRIDDSSPGAFQDETMDNSYTSFDAARAPNAAGCHSPLVLQGRSLRELEEQMSTLRKENFNLKLRIYFMEEGQQSARSINGGEGLAKQLIDAKIEIEVLRKTVDEKTELLKDAAQAISQHEDMQRRTDVESHAAIEQMQEHIRQIEFKVDGETNKFVDIESSEKLKIVEAEVFKLESALLEADRQLKASMIQTVQMEQELMERKESLVACEAKIEELAIKNAELVEKIEKDADSCSMANLRDALGAQLADKMCELEEAENKLKERERIHEQACRTIQKLMQKLSSQEREIKRLSQQETTNNKENVNENAIISAVAERRSLSDSEALAIDSSSASVRIRFEQQAAEQDEIIKKLRVELEKKSANVQQVLTSFADQQNDALVTQLRRDLHLAQTDAESSNKWRAECADVCSILTNRLEELAGFLNSLLKHKDVLGVLAADRRHAMRRAVDRSLDLSKSLNMTLSITGASLADQSFAQLCNLSEILSADVDADECNQTYNSHEDNQVTATSPPSIETLKAENKALKRELEKRRSVDGQQRKERRSLPLPTQQQQQLDNQSESEAWSEPDRKVSLARIGLDEASSSLVGEQQQLTESDSERQQGRTTTVRQERSRTSERIAQLEELIAQRDERILDVQCQLVDADNRYKQEQLRVIELSQRLEQTVELQRIVELRTRQLEQLQQLHNSLTADAQVTEMELVAAQQHILQLRQTQTEAVDQVHAELTQLKVTASEQLEEERRLHLETLARDWVDLATHEEQKQQLLELQRQHVECMRALEYHQENEQELKQTLVENELATRALKKQLDESTLQASKAVMERTKAYNDKLHLEERLEELRLQLTLLKDEQRQQQELKRQQQSNGKSSDVSQSGYTSEEMVPIPVLASAAIPQRLNISSPDLGIESDACRASSVELSNAQQRTMLRTLESKDESTNKNVEDVAVKKDLAAADAEIAARLSKHDCAKVDQENAELRRKLIRTKRAFEDTYEKLRLANRAKAQVEKDIKNQILKTHNVLRNVRSNMENEL